MSSSETTSSGKTVFKFPRMDVPYIKKLCKQQELYSTPSLNDKLYLHFQGFRKIENLEEYNGLRSLWLEGNAISKIENLGHLKELRCLFLHQNCIEKIENLDGLEMLDTLNLSQNQISRIENLAPCKKLSTLNLANNLIASSPDLEGLRECPSIRCLDLSHNRLEDPSILDILRAMSNLSVLYLTGNPVVQKIKSYRKTLISSLPKLHYLDDRPVTDEERLACEAWSHGGVEAEREERQRQRDERIRKDKESLDAFRRMQDDARRKRELGLIDMNKRYVSYVDEPLQSLEEPEALYFGDENELTGENTVGATSNGGNMAAAVPPLEPMDMEPDSPATTATATATTTTATTTPGDPWKDWTICIPAPLRLLLLPVTTTATPTATTTTQSGRRGYRRPWKPIVAQRRGPTTFSPAPTERVLFQMQSDPVWDPPPRRPSPLQPQLQLQQQAQRQTPPKSYFWRQAQILPASTTLPILLAMTELLLPPRPANQHRSHKDPQPKSIPSCWTPSSKNR